MNTIAEDLAVAFRLLLRRLEPEDIQVLRSVLDVMKRAEVRLLEEALSEAEVFEKR